MDIYVVMDYMIAFMESAILYFFMCRTLDRKFRLYVYILCSLFDSMIIITLNETTQIDQSAYFAVLIFEFLVLLTLFKDKFLIKVFVLLGYNMLIIIADTIFTAVPTMLFGYTIDQILELGNLRLVMAMGSKLLSFVAILGLSSLIKKIKSLYGLWNWKNYIFVIVIMADLFLSLRVISITNKYSHQEEIFNLLMIVLVGMSLLCFGSIWSLMQSQINANTRAELMMVRENMKHQMQYTKELGIRYDENRQLRHDIRHHVQMIQMLMSEKKPDELREYVESLGERAEVKVRRDTGNTYIDAVLSIKYEEAKKENINITISAQPVNDNLKYPMEVSTILYNGIQNAIEACKKLPQDEREVNIQLFMKGSFVINISNSCMGVETRKGKLVTTKKDKELHGIGINGIEYAVKKIGGSWVWNYNELSRQFDLVVEL